MPFPADSLHTDDNSFAEGLNIRRLQQIREPDRENTFMRQTEKCAKNREI